MTAKKALRHGKYPYHRAVNEVVWVTGLEIAPNAFTKKREVPKTRTITGFVAGVPVAGFHRISRIFAGFPGNNAQIMPTKMSGTRAAFYYRVDKRKSYALDTNPMHSFVDSTINLWNMRNSYLLKSAMIL